MDIQLNVHNEMERLLGEPRRYRYVLACSAGLDSMALWHAWNALYGDTYVVAHFDHGVRSDTGEDARLIQTLAERRGVSFRVGRRDGSAPTSEAALRDDRYRFLESLRREVRADFVVTAHHADDQWETLQMRLVRGTGLDGLGCMAPLRERRIRPLLSVSRAELEAYACRHRLDFREDSTNESPRYFRNRVRSRLAPPWRELAGEFGGACEALRRLHDTLEEIRETALWMREEEQRLLEGLAVCTPLWWRISSDAFRKLPDLWQRRVLRALCRTLETREVGRQGWESLRDAVLAGRGFDLTARIRYRHSCGWGFFLRPGVSPQWERQEHIWRCPELGLEVELSDLSPPGARVRFLQPGDRFAGRKMKVRLGRMRIPAPERKWIPVLAPPTEPPSRAPAGSDLLWHFPQPAPLVRMSRLNFAFSFLDAAPLRIR